MDSDWHCGMQVNLRSAPEVNIRSVPESRCGDIPGFRTRCMAFAVTPTFIYFYIYSRFSLIWRGFGIAGGLFRTCIYSRFQHLFGRRGMVMSCLSLTGWLADGHPSTSKLGWANRRPCRRVLRTGILRKLRMTAVGGREPGRAVGSAASGRHRAFPYEAADEHQRMSGGVVRQGRHTGRSLRWDRVSGEGRPIQWDCLRRPGRTNPWSGFPRRSWTLPRRHLRNHPGE